jgi:hypothetical protein
VISRFLTRCLALFGNPYRSGVSRLRCFRNDLAVFCRPSEGMMAGHGDKYDDQRMYLKPANGHPLPQDRLASLGAHGRLFAESPRRGPPSH